MALTFRQALREFEKRQETRIELGLDRLRSTLERLGRPQEGFPSIVVAGTNGKGSVAAMLESVLRAAGLRTGLATSPHLLSIAERIRVAGRPVSGQRFAEAISRVLAAEREPLTFFELVTAAAFVEFARARVDAAVLEVGLGGRLDAVNVVRRPLLSVIASVGHDHASYLGPTLTSIAREKAGVLRPGGAALAGPLPDEAADAVRREAKRLGARLSILNGRAPLRPGRTDWSAGVQHLEGPGGPWRLSLLGARQIDNASLVLLACRALSRRGLQIPASAARAGLSSARWPGRFSVVRCGGRTWVLDGAHNAEAARAFAETWAASPFQRSGTFIVALLRDKDPEALFEPLRGLARRVIACRAPSLRALAPEALAEAARRGLPGAEVETARDLRSALARAPIGKACAVVGSFYLVAQAYRELGVDPWE